jgi:acetyl-CoA carboxylase biotin carboxylase subunit
MAEVALRGARAVGYYSAGTFEFLVDADEFYFLEMNTRLQVEHPITELVTGIDLVQKMLCVAAGEPLGIQQSELARRGAAIECRLYAEDPARGFLPAPGTIRQLIPAGGPGVREDSGVQAGSIISGHYDPLISKLCAWAPDRAQAVSRMRRALGEYLVTGVRTNIAFLQQLFEHSEYVAGRYDTGFVERYFEELCRTALPRDADAKPAAAAIAVAAYNEERKGSPPAKSLPSPWLAAHRFGRRG